MRRLSTIGLAAALGACIEAPVPTKAAYRALGTEPFWNLRIDDHVIAFVEPGRQPIIQPPPKAIIGFAGEIYRTARIDVSIVHVRCTDGMRDRIYPDKVRVTVDGRQSDGCGGL